MEMKLRNYFNKECFGTFGPGWSATLGGISSVFLLSSGSIPAAALGVAMIAYTAGQVNRWQEAATGKPIWKSSTGHFGI